MIGRREFVGAGVGALAAGCVGVRGAPALNAAQPAPAAVADYELECGWIATSLAGTPVRLRAYNGQVPGPLLEARPGDTLRVRLRNALTPYDSTGWTHDHNVPHALDTTNLHLHGLEIVPHLFEPVGTKDPLAQMIAVGPGASQDYVVAIPADHPCGLFWYHPHHHGSTAVQAVSGMAGGIIIRGDIDDVPEIRAAREIVVVMNDIGLFPSEDDPNVFTYDPVQNSIWQTSSGSVTRWDPATQQNVPAPELRGGFTTGDYALRYMLVNGEPYFREVHNDDAPTDPVGTQLDVPRFTLRPGEVVRVRMLNANSDNLMPIVVAGHELHLLALDGVNFPAPRTIAAVPADGSGGEQLLLAPANRAEFMIRAGAPGIYPIVQLAQSQQFLNSARKVIAEIEVAGTPVSMGIPTALPLPRRHYPLAEAKDVVRRRNVVFTGGFPGVLNPIVGLDFMLNNSLYDERSVEAVVALDTVEEWRLSVPDHDHGGSEGHPFHIHVNSFEVVSIGGVAQPAGTIQDTVWVPVNTEVIIRMRFREWTGKSVFHCHILPHEDTGMMQNFLIL